jgi:DNA (cytosine-5)-methyltransferase 1
LAQSSTGSGAPGYSNQEIFSQNCANLVPQPVPIQDGREIEKRQNGLGIWQPGDPAYTVNTTEAQAVAFAQNQREEVREVEVPGALAAEPGTHQQTYIAQPVPFTKAKRAQSVTDDETWVQGQVNPTLSLFDQGDTRATTVAVAHAFYSTDGTHGVNQHPEVSPAVKVGSGLGIPSPPAVAQAMTVRRLTPVECERLQGFPDDWTLIPWRGKPAEQCPDGPRYKALGNSMACNCMAWIGEQIAKWEADHA